MTKLAKLEKLQLSIYNIVEIKKLFGLNKKIVAYGHGNFYKKVKNILEFDKLFFNDIYFTDKGNIKSKLEDNYVNRLKDTVIIICSSFNDEIINIINNQNEKPFKVVMLNISKNNKYYEWYKEHLSLKMQLKHFELLKELKGKEKIKVVFLAIHKSVWKVDSVFQKMLNDPLFEPEILICPYVQYGEERMLEDMEQAYNYFDDKGYHVRKSLKEDGTWYTLDEIKPDIVFFTNPHNLTRKEYYEDAYLNYLSCYVPYYFMATNHAGDKTAQINTVFLISLWKIYWAHSYTKKLSVNQAANKGINSFCFGYPAVEKMVTASLVSDPWKAQLSSRKKIIYAPHHTICNKENSLSTFLSFSEFIKTLAINNKEKTQWSFKPHPILKTKLYLHPLWGKDKTDAYYDFWKNQSYTQLDENEYEELFLTSDAIIHDCSSFIVEYAFTKKPCLYLVNENNLEGLLNEFGEGVMQIYEQARTEEEIDFFVDGIVNETINPDKEKRAYFESYVNKYYKDKLPSELIIDDLKQSLGFVSDQ